MKIEREKLKLDNTLILVDYDNVFVTLKNNYRDFKNPNIMYDVISKIIEKYSGDNILSCRLFADFQKVQISDDGYDILKKNHVEIEHVFNGRNASDVILMINCMKYMMQYPHIDKIILVSSDSDLVPIFHEVKLLNKKLEVLYFKVNTSEEHIVHMEEADIIHHSVEELMGVSTYQECADLNEFYNFKISDKEYFTQLLEKINEIMVDAYNKFLQKDSMGNVTNAGIVKISELVDQIKERGICTEKELRKNTDTSYTNIICMLQEKNIIIRHDYSINGKKYNTLILSESYLTQNSIEVNDLLKPSDYPNT